MNIKIIWVITVILALSCAVYSKESEWFIKMKQIQLLSSTYDDVIKVLGTPDDGNDEKELAETFETKEGTFWVGFTTGECLITYSGDLTGWKVPAWTASRISFTPNKPFSPRKLPIKTKGFRKYEIKDSPGVFAFENDEAGIEYGINRKGKVDDISFYPGNQFNNLRCK